MAVSNTRRLRWATEKQLVFGGATLCRLLLFEGNLGEQLLSLQRFSHKS